MTPVVSEDSLKRIIAADDLLTAALARLPSAEHMRHARTIGVVKVLFSGVQKLPATVPGRADDNWTALLDKLEPQIDLCAAAATVTDLAHRFTVLNERIGRVLDDIAVLAVVIEPHCAEHERLARLTMLAQQEFLALAGARLDRKLSRVEQALGRHHSTDEARTGEFLKSLNEFKIRLAAEVDRQATDHDERTKQWQNEFSTLAGKLKDVTELERVNRITQFYGPAERQERIRVNAYATLCVTFITIAIIAAGFGFYAHQTVRGIAAIAGSATLFTLLSSAAAIMRRELRAHRDRLWAVENDHRRMVGTVLFHPNMTDAQQERLVEELFNESFLSRAPKQEPATRSAKAPKPRPEVPRASQKER